MLYAREYILLDSVICVRGFFPCFIFVSFRNDSMGSSNWKMFFERKYEVAGNKQRYMSFIKNVSDFPSTFIKLCEKIQLGLHAEFVISLDL